MPAESARVTSPPLYFRADVEFDNGPFRDLTLIEVAALVLDGTSMNVTDMTQTPLRHALTAWLKRDERFELRGGRWGDGGLAGGATQLCHLRDVDPALEALFELDRGV